MGDRCYARKGESPPPALTLGKGPACFLASILPPFEVAELMKGINSSSYPLLVSLGCFPLALPKAYQRGIYLQVSSLAQDRDSRSNKYHNHHSDFHFLQLEILPAYFSRQDVQNNLIWSQFAIFQDSTGFG